MNDPIETLILAHLDGQISDEAFAELEERLASEPAARQTYAELSRLDGELREVGADGGDVAAVPNRKSAPWNSYWIAGWVLAAGIVVTSIPVWMVLFPTSPAIPDQFVSNNSPVESIAVISAEAGAKWNQESTVAVGNGMALGSGTLVLDEGLAQLDFFSGASITLSGPAKIELRSAKLAILHSGTIRADVPPAARGFEIQTANVRVEDLGTSFGIVADNDGRSDVVVFDGEVRAIQPSGKSLSLLTGDAATLTNGKAEQVAAANFGPFPDISAVVQQSEGHEQSRYENWRKRSIERHSDPRIVAYYDFEGLTEASRRLPNRARAGGQSDLDGGIVGARATQGRWPGKTALDFRREGDRVRFRIPGEFDAMTLYMWVRIDALDRHSNSLFLTDYFDPGEIHWQISRTGSLRFATSPVGVPGTPENTRAFKTGIQIENRRFFSEPFWDSSKSGQWFLIATTADRKASPSVVHYVNGKRLKTVGGSNQNQPLPKLRLGSADLGNWTDPIEYLDQIRSLNGRVDEFAIFSEALSAEEIQTIYEQGKP